ncbi:MAG: hypothetical protein HQ542_01070, partial [Bacteroidia bacterium]|nr:hypothetical protein [Bacteroidia bacterium]
MKKHASLIAGIVFFLIASGIILNSKRTFMAFPSQEVWPKGDVEFGSLIKGFVFTQEITLEKEYLNAVEMVLQTSKRGFSNSNSITILDSNFHILYTERFTNEGLHFPKSILFSLSRKVKLGKGSKVYLCFNSSNSDRENHLILTRETYINDSTKIYAQPLINNDLITTLKSGKEKYYAPGSLCYRIYESNFNPQVWFRASLILIVLCVSLVIIFYSAISKRIMASSLRPERIFLALALLFGTIILIVTPPLQVPDEDQHFYRAY